MSPAINGQLLLVEIQSKLLARLSVFTSSSRAQQIHLASMPGTTTPEVADAFGVRQRTSERYAASL
jgi:hypothetical protein